MKTNKIFYGLVLLLILLFAGAISFSLYQTLPKKQGPSPIPAQTSKTSPSSKTSTPSTVPSINPAAAKTPNTGSKVLNPPQPQITTTITIESTDSGKIKGKLSIENKTG